MTESGWETLPDVPEWWEAILDVRQYSGGPPGCPGARPGCLGVVKRPSQMSGSGLDALPDVREWSRVYPECPGVVGRPSQLSVSGGRPFRSSAVAGSVSQMCGSGREALPDVRDWPGCPPRCPEVVETPSLMSGNVREALLDVRE